MKSLDILQQRGLRFSGVLPIATPILLPFFKPHQPFLNKFNIRLIHQQADIALQASDVVLVASGTATLEAMLYKKPMVVGYKFSTLTGWLMKHIITTKYVALPNILASQKLVPELLQANFSAQNCADALQKYLDNPDKIFSLQQEFLRIHRTLITNSNQKIQACISRLINNYN